MPKLAQRLIYRQRNPAAFQKSMMLNFWVELRIADPHPASVGTAYSTNRTLGEAVDAGICIDGYGCSRPTRDLPDYWSKGPLCRKVAVHANKNGDHKATVYLP